MEWLNPFGLLIIAVIMIPNILFAVKCKDRLRIAGAIKRLKLWNKSAGSAVLVS